jgi:hypothetical protein
MFEPGSLSKESPISIRDRIFGIASAFSALYCLAVSFMLSQAEARKRFFIGLAVFAFCFYFVRRKKGVALGIGSLVAIRLVWGLIAAALQGGRF